MIELAVYLEGKLVLQCAEILYFDIDIKNITMILLTDNLFGDTAR
jgi:hypothetical protein